MAQTRALRQVKEQRTSVISRDSVHYVFPGRDGCANQHMTNPSIGWTRILKRAGIESLRMHDLRRSLASFQIDTGTPLEVIQKTLGHESKMTTEIYARMALEPVRARLERATAEILRLGK